MVDGSRILGAALAMALVANAGPRQAHAAMPRATRLKVMKSVVKLRVLINRGGRWVQTGHGSGSVISSDGLILTNNHVVQNTKTGQLFDAIAVAPNEAFDTAPKPICIAYPRRAIRHSKLDLAIIKCEADMQGRPLRQALGWPNVVDVGDSSTLIPGDELFVVGFPGVGGSTITFTSGKVAGFLADKRVGTGRVWIKTDALISGGVSGGAAFDTAGKLIGVPTAYRRGSRGHTNIGLVRVINKARPLIAMARSKPWTQLPRVASRLPRPGEGPGGLRYPEQTPRRVRPLPNRIPLDRMEPRPGPGPAQVDPPRGRRVPPPPPARARVPRPGSGYSAIAGRVVDGATLRPIAGAMVAVMHQGVDVFRLTRGTLARAIATGGIANARGFFISKRPLRQGGVHGFIVVANGYTPLRINNALRLMRGAPPQLDLGLIKLRRRGLRAMPRRRLPQLEELEE